MQSSKKITKGFIQDFISDSTQVALDSKANDADVLHKAGNEVKSGNLTLLNDLILPNIVTDTSSDVANIGISTVTNRLVTIPIDENLEVSVTNKTGSTITKGSAVYINGAQGSKPTIALALADTNLLTSLAIGIVKDDILNNATGYIVTEGIIEKLNTSLFTEGDRVFLSPTVPGGITTVVPTSPNNVVFIGTIVDAHITQGKILVSTAYTFKLDRLVDVSIATPSNNEVLTYETSSGLWKNKSLSTIGGVTGTGTANYIAKWSSTSALSNSLLYDNGTNVLINSIVDNGVDKLQVTGSTNLSGTLSIGSLLSGVYQNYIYAMANNDAALFQRRGSYGSVIRIGRQAASNGTTIDYPTDNAFAISTANIERLRVVGNNGALILNTTIDNGIDQLQVNGSILSSAFKKTGGLSSEFLKADGSVDSLFYTPISRTLNINGNSLDLSANREWRTAQADTGILTFASPGLSVASATQINIGAVTGWVIDNETNPAIPVSAFVNYAGASNVTVTTLGSGTSSYVLLSSSGVISFQNTFPTSAERKSKIWLGKISHPAGSITFTINEPDYITSPQALTRDFFQSISYVNEGVIPYANGANLNINITQGEIFGNGINFVNSRTNPNELVMGPNIAASFVYRTQTGGATGAVTAIDPNNYDVGGVITPVGGGANTSTIQYIFAVPGIGYVIQYGQNTYSTLASAISSISRETFTQWSNLVKNTILIGVLAVQKGATQLNDVAQAQFFRADFFGQITGATSGVSTGTLQTTYNNSSTPEIVTNSSLGSLTIRRGSAADTDNVIEVQNGAGAITAGINGNGIYSGGASLTGTPTAPTATIGTNTTQIATTAFVQNALISGTYTPSFTNTTNIASSSANGLSTYTRIGNIVTAVINYTVAVTTPSTPSVLTVTLPIARSVSTVASIGHGSLVRGSGENIYLSTSAQTASNTTQADIVLMCTSASVFVGSLTIQYSVT